MSKIILDVRSGERNDSATGLCLRVVDASVVEIDGRYERVGRDLYEIGSSGVSDYVLIASGDGSIGVESVSVSFEKLFNTAIDGVYYYLTNSRVWLSSVLDENGDGLDHFFGGTVVHSARDDLDSPNLEGTGVCGGLFWWSRNDVSRERFVYEDRGWKLLKGGSGVALGVVGGEEDLVVKGLSGELRIGGGDVSLSSVTVYEIGDEDVFPVVAEGEEDGKLAVPGVEGVVLNPSGKVLFKEGTEHTGKSVLHISGALGVSEDSTVGSGGYLSPQPMLNEYPLLRAAGYGYSEVVFVATEGDLVDAEYGKVKVSLDSGRILTWEDNHTDNFVDIIYEGLVLCDAPVSLGSGVDISSVPLMSVPDGSGLTPTGLASDFRPTGIGLKQDYRYERMYVSIGGRVLPVDLVERLPKKLSKLRGYLLQDSTSISLNRGWSSTDRASAKLFSGHVSLSRGGLRHQSILKLKDKTGSFKVDGSVVSFDGETVSGSGVSVVDGYLLVDEGSIVNHPETASEFESLKEIGLVPSSSLETGLEFVLTRPTIKGYYSFDEEKVADISGSTTFQFLQFEPRVDFSGYEVGKFFKVGDKVLDSSEIEGDFGGNPNGFHWITERSISSTVSQETSRLVLGAGIRVGSTEIKIKQEQLDGTIPEQILKEGVDYDLPSNGLEGQARLINRLGAEVLSGQKVGTLTGLDLDLEVSLGSVKAGDFFYDGLNYFKIEDVSGTTITLSSVLGLETGRWKIYAGYREGLEAAETPDPTKIVGEILDDLPVLERSAAEVYKVYTTLAFDKVLPSSTLYVRKDDVSYPLTVLRDEVLKPPYELSGDHYTSGSYRIKVGVKEYEAGVIESGEGFTVVNNRVVFEKDGVTDSSWVDGEVIFVRKPRVGLTDMAEMDLGLNLTSPFTPTDSFDEFLELLANPKIEPSSGAISFETPLESGVGVEVSYIPTDDPDGVRVIEVMGFVVVQEETTRVDDFVFTYNPNNKEVELLASPTVMVGAEQISSSLYNIDQNTIRFASAISSDFTVRISYTTLSSNGGDATVRTSSGMVIPKYKIDKGSSTLNVFRDFSSVLSPGDLVHVDTQIFSVSSISANTISVSPPARVNIETDMIAYLNVPSFTYGGSTSSYAFRSITGARVVSSPKSPDLFIQGDYRDFIKAKSILLVQGVPYRAKVVDLDEATGMTKVSVEGFTVGHGFVSNGDFHVSFRPVLIEGDTSLTLTTGIVNTEPFQLVKYDHTLGRGRLLVLNEDYNLNTEAGLIDLKGNHKVLPQVSYYLLHTALSGVKPFTLLGGRVSKPSYKATFNQSKSPDTYDGLGLNASCVVSSPDTFQLRVADEETYSSEVANDLQQSLDQGTGSGGKQVVSSPTAQGKAIGVYDLLASDVVARSRVNLYNGYVQPIDDLISTTTGKVVGDADGSFKFNLLSSGDWIAAGMEDSITREIYPRYVSMEFLTPLNPSNPYPTPNDPIKIKGDPPEAKELAELLEQQRALIENEIDDIVLIRQKETTSFDLSADFPFIRVDYDPIYSPMWKRHKFSRLFPTRTRMYSYRNPGALDSTTNGITIANVQNNSLGQIENISSLTVVKRRPARFRVYDFSPVGFAAAPSSVGKPTFIVSAVPFEDFPIDVSTGQPDTTQFVSNNGEVPDAKSGNNERTFNGLQTGSKLRLSRSGGEFHNVLNTAERATLIELGLFPPLDLKAEPRNATVAEIVDGCYVVLSGNPFSLKINGESLIENPPKRGDTLSESFARDLDDDSSPTTSFRVGSDIGLRSSTGELVDISLPSINEPNWPIKEIVGQNVPAGGLALEGDVSFTYTGSVPFNYPALEGEAFDDTGDESIPYMNRFNERDLLPQIPPALDALKVKPTNAISGQQEYSYPDEARGTASIGSGVITTSEDFSNLNLICEQTPRQGDLVILKPDTSSATGVLELAEISFDEILPPTFVSPCDVLCTLENLSVNLTDSGGLSIEENWVANNSGVYDRSETKFTFMNNYNVLSLFTNPSAGLEIKIHIHNFSSNTNNPNKNYWSFIFSYDGSSWTVGLYNEVSNTLTAASNITSVSCPLSNRILVVQEPVPDPYDPTVNPSEWDTTNMNSWLYSDFWDEANIFYSSATPSGGSDGSFILSEQAPGGPNSIDYRLSVTSPAQIANNRLDVVFPSFRYDYTLITDPVYADGEDTTKRLIITNSSFDVREEGGSGVHYLNSDVNNKSFTSFDTQNNITFRPKALDGVSRTDDPMSIFIGSEVDESGTILKGTARSGLVEVDSTDPANLVITGDSGKGILRNVSPAHGSVDQVLTGDILYIESGHNAGTHRVRGVVKTDATIELTETLGSSVLLPVVFPKVVSVVNNGGGIGTITTDVPNLSDYFDATGGELFILLNNNYLNKPLSVATHVYDELYGFSQVHVEYDSITDDGWSFTFTENTNANQANPHYADGEKPGGGGQGQGQGGPHPTGVTINELITLVGEGQQTIGGLTRIPFNTLSLGYGEIPVSLDNTIEIYFNVGGGYTGSKNNLEESKVERDENNMVVAFNLPSNIYERVTDNPEGNEYHDTFITPNDTIKITVNVSAGIYLDPTFPRLLRDYTGNTPVKFGATPSEIPSQVRSPIESTLTNLPAYNFYEMVSFTVRRFRRFTDVFSKLIYAFEGFRYLYEQRKGRVNTVVYANGVITLTPLKVDGDGVEDTNGTDTQVGEFINVVNFGDQVKCFNGQNQETLYLRVLEVGATLKCSVIRGSVSDVSTGDVFKIISRTPLIPELQAFDQFVEHSFTEIYSTDPVEGISVIEENKLTDTSGVDFIALGVEAGDFLVIDPQGLLAGTNSPEYGAPPQGDNGDGTLGIPNTLDDNRGAYKVLSVVDSTTLEVVFYAGEGGTTRSTYKLLPSAQGNDNQPLRVTSGIVGGTYATTTQSIHPFSYRLLRKNATLQESLAGSILFFRERTLSWVEIIRSFNSLPTQPYTWSQYESEGLIDSVGVNDNSHPSNDVLIQSILGNQSLKPFKNNETCLSVYDRRMLIEDPKMESELYGAPEAGLPTVLENDISSMNARGNRYAWISIRTDQINGTLAKLSRVDLNNPDDTALEDIK